MKLFLIVLISVILITCSDESVEDKFVGVKFCSLLSEMDRNDRMNRWVMLDEYNTNRYKKERELQNNADSINTLLLIEIIKTRGFPKPENCGCDTFPEAVFMHSPPFFYPEIRKLIEQEYEKGRISEIAFSLYEYHINGRNIEDRDAEFFEETSNDE